MCMRVRGTICDGWNHFREKSSRRGAYRPTVFPRPHQVTTRPTFVTSQVPPDQPARWSAGPLSTIIAAFTYLSQEIMKFPGADTAARGVVAVRVALFVIAWLVACVFSCSFRNFFGFRGRNSCELARPHSKNRIFALTGVLARIPLLCPR